MATTPGGNVAPGPSRYWAFISYSHADEAWAQWLHRALETWRVPRRLVGRALGDEKVPSRLFPIFRDRDELPSSHELGAVINQALAGSRNLIVICSPRSATSRWVNEEIKAFRALGRSHRVFCLIVDGEPHASSRPEIAFSECFPPALREEGFEPIAADARERKDGKAGAKLKLIAGLLNLGLDELKQREKQRQRRDRLLAGAAALAVVTALGGVTQWFVHQRAAREREIRIDKLVESGRRELLDAHNARAAVFLTEALKLGHDTVPLRYMLGQAMQAVDAQTNVRFNHGGTVLRAAFSADASRVAMAVQIKDEVVGKVFDTKTGALQAEVSGLPAFPRVLRFYPDGQRLFVTGFKTLENDQYEDGPVTGVWSLDQRAPLLLLEGNAGRFGAALSPDGAQFLVARPTGIELWDAQQLRKQRVLSPGNEAVTASFSSDGKRILTADANGKVETWSRPQLHLEGTLPGADGLTLVGLIADGAQVIGLSATGDVRIWDLGKRSLKLAFLGDPVTIFHAQLSTNGRRLLTLGREGYKVWSTSRGLLALSINRQLGTGASGTLAPSGNYLYLASGESSTAEVWSVLGGARLYSLDAHAQRVTTVSLTPDGHDVLTASADGRAETWAGPTRPLWDMELQGLDPYVVKFVRDPSDLVVAGGTDGQALLQRRSTTVAMEWPGHESLVADADLSAARDTLLTASTDGRAKLWRTDTGAVLASIEHSPRQPLRVARLSPDATRALTCAGSGLNDGDIGSCVLWEMPSGRAVAALDHPHVSQAVFDHAGTRLATAGVGGLLKFWRTNDGAALRTISGHTAKVTSIAFSHDDRSLVSAAEDKTVKLWDITNGALRAELTAPGLGSPTTAAFAPGDDLVAVGTDDGTIWSWLTTAGTATAMPGHSAQVLGLRFLHDGRLLLSSSGDGSVRAWDPATGAPLGRVAINRLQVYDFDVNASETLIATASLERVVAYWNVALEGRSPGEIDRTLECRAPWSLVGDELAGRTPPEACAP